MPNKHNIICPSFYTAKALHDHKEVVTSDLLLEFHFI